MIYAAVYLFTGFVLGGIWVGIEYNHVDNPDEIIRNPLATITIFTLLWPIFVLGGIGFVISYKLRGDND